MSTELGGHEGISETRKIFRQKGTRIPNLLDEGQKARCTKMKYKDTPAR